MHAHTWGITEKTIGRYVQIGGRRRWIDIAQYLPLILGCLLGFVRLGHIDIAHVLAIVPMIASAGIVGRRQLRAIVVVIEWIEIDQSFIFHTGLDHFQFILVVYLRSILLVSLVLPWFALALSKRYH